MTLRTVLACLVVFAAACERSEPELTITDEQIDQIREVQRPWPGGDALLPFETIPRPIATLAPPVSNPMVTLAPPATNPIGTRHTPEDLDIDVDADGRPYDVEQGWYEGKDVERFDLGRFVAPNGEIVIMDGNLLEIDPVGLEDGETVVVEFDVDRIALSRFAIDEPGAEDGAPTATVGIRLDVPDGGPVVAWQRFEFAYGTSGGVGGVTTGAIVAGAAGQPSYVESDRLFAAWDYEDDFYLGRHAATSGNDVFIFSNGFGDGGFPMTRGIDAEGRLVSLMLPTMTYPWRLMVPDGEPPPDVSDREQEYIECLNGERAVTLDGRCLSGPMS